VAPRKAGGPFRRLLEIALDRASAERTQRETQDALRKGTDPKVAQRNLGLVGRAMEGLRAIGRRVVVDLVGLFQIVARQFGRVAGMVREVENAYGILRRSTGDTGAVLQGLQRDLRAAFATGPEGIEAVATAMGSLRTSTGLAGVELQKITRLALDFARVNGQDAAGAADMLGQLINRLGLEASMAEGLLDRLTLAGQGTGISVQELGQTLLATSPQLTSLGLSLNDQIALISQLSKVGADVPAVMVGIQQAMTRLAAGGATDLSAAFQQLLTDIRQAPSEAEALTIAAEAFGSRVAARMVPDIRAGRLEIGAWADQIANAGGTLRDTERESRTMGDTVRTVANELHTTIIPALNAIGKAAGAVAVVGMKALQLAVQGVQGAVVGAYQAFLQLQEGFLRLRIMVHRWQGAETRQLEANLRANRAAQADYRAEIEASRNAQAEVTGEAQGTADAFAAVREAVVGTREAIALTSAELRKQADERLAALLTAYRLQIATTAEVEELVVRYNQTRAALEAGNLALEERIRLQTDLNQITSTIPRLQAPEIQAPRMPGIVHTMSTDPIVDVVAQRNALAQSMADIWMEANADMVAASQRAAMGVAGAFQDAFTALHSEMDGLQAAVRTLLAGAGAAALGYLADIASTKVQENVVRALENLALAKGYTAVGNFAGAAAAGAAAKDHGLAALGWAALGGMAAAGQAAASSGRGGQSGGLASGARDPAGRAADQVGQSNRATYIYVNPFDPTTPAIQSAAYEAVLARAQKAGGRVRLVYTEGR
jgi:hypothetical protein